MPFVYEPQYRIAGWFEDSGIVLISWLDRDLSDSTVVPPFFVNANTFFIPTLTFTLQNTQFFRNTNTFPSPNAIMLTAQVHQMLKNEIRRTYFLSSGGGGRVRGT